MVSGELKYVDLIIPSHAEIICYINIVHVIGLLVLWLFSQINGIDM